MTCRPIINDLYSVNIQTETLNSCLSQCVSFTYQKMMRSISLSWNIFNNFYYACLLCVSFTYQKMKWSIALSWTRFNRFYYVGLRCVSFTYQKMKWPISLSWNLLNSFFYYVCLRCESFTYYSNTKCDTFRVWINIFIIIQLNKWSSWNLFAEVNIWIRSPVVI